MNSLGNSVLAVIAAALPLFGHILALNPAMVTAGGPGFDLDIEGFNMDTSDVLTWNGNLLPVCSSSPVAPCFQLIDSTRMIMKVPPSYIANPGGAIVGLVGFGSLVLVIQPATVERVIAPQIADGGGAIGGWQSSLKLANTSITRSATAAIRFFSSTGAPQPMPLAGIGRVSQLTRQLPPGGSVTLDTDGTDPTLATGWAEITSSGVGQGMPSVTSFTIFRQRIPGGRLAEASAPSAVSEARDVLFSFDNMGGYETSVAVVNPSASAADVTATFRGEASPAIIHQETFRLPAQGHSAFGTATRFPRIAGMRGSATFSAAGGGRISVLVLSFSPALSFVNWQHTVLR